MEKTKSEIQKENQLAASIAIIAKYAEEKMNTPEGIEKYVVAPDSVLRQHLQNVKNHYGV